MIKQFVDVTYYAYEIEQTAIKFLFAKQATILMLPAPLTLLPRYISLCLGNVKLQKMERRQLLTFQKELSEENLSIRTCNNIVKILKIVLNDAVTD